MSEQKPRTIESVTEVEVELQRRKHKKTVFGTVPQSPRKLAIEFLADEMEKNDVVEKLKAENERLQNSFNALATNLSKAMELNKKMNAELDMHIKMFELIEDWGLAGNILHYKDLTDKLEQIQEEHDQPTLNSHPENEEEAW